MHAPPASTHPTIGEQIRKTAAAHPDRDWIITRDRRVTYMEMDQASDRLAHGLTERGVEQGDTVLVMLPNTIEFVSVFCALGKMGALQVPVNTAYRGGIFRHVVNDSLARIMIVDRDYIERLEFIAEELTQLETLIIYASNGTVDSDLELPPKLAARCTAMSFEEASADSSAAFEREIRYSDLMGVLYTSGTTGPSKGVMTTYAHCYDYASGPLVSGFLDAGAVYYAPLPLFHIGGMWAVVYACCIAGATAILIPSFSVSSFWQDVRDHGITSAFLLGAMVNFIYQQPRRDDDAETTLRHVLMAPVLPQVEAFMERFGCKVWTAYGSTETSCPIYGDGKPPNSETCGRVVSDQWQLRVVDDNDMEVPDGEIGELVVRPRDPWVIMAGYWNNPEATVSAWRNLWFHTGDLMKRDTDGWYYFVDRKKDAIRRRGENISSMEVENEINAHPDVVESAVIPVWSEHSEQEVMAVVVLREGADLAHEELIKYLEPRMAYFMMPRYVDFVPELPKTSTGKVQKYELRDTGLTRTTWDREAVGLSLSR